MSALNVISPKDYEKLASRRDGRLPVHTGINRQFFTYKTLSDAAYDGNI